MQLVRRSPLRAVALAIGCCLIAAPVFLNHLGSSSLFSDEGYSWHVASSPFFHVFSGDWQSENTPPLYYLLLHFWMDLFGSSSVWGMRLLSVLGALIAVAGTSWLGNQLAGTGGAIAAGLAIAFAPLVVQYAQDMRAYALLLGATAVAGAAAIQTGRSGPAHQPRWLALCTVMSVAMVWLHYSGILVAAIIAAYVWTTASLTESQRRIHAGVVLAAIVIVTPLMFAQLGSGHQGGVAPFAHLTGTNLLRVLGTPFDGRFGPQPITYLPGAAATVIACGVLAVRSRGDAAVRERRLILAAAVTPVAALILVNLGAWITDESSYYSLITRYSAVATPFMLAAVGYAVLRGPLLLKPVIVVLAGIACVTGLIGDYSRHTRWPDLGGAFGYVEQSLKPGDIVSLAGYPTQGDTADYYLDQLAAHGNPRLAAFDTLTSVKAPMIFVITDAATAQTLRASLPAEGLNVVAVEEFYPDAAVVVVS